MRKLYFRLRRKIAILSSRLLSDKKRYAAMQKAIYSFVDSKDDHQVKEVIVGHYEAHEEYPYEKYLLRDIRDPSQVAALDFGCGPGRMILRMSKLLRRTDGVDISAKLIEICGDWTRGIDSVGRLYVNDGTSLEQIESDQYDLVYSTIALQHISAASVREGLFREFHRVLRREGRLALQMIYTDKPREQWSSHATWNQDLFDAEGTNGQCDVLITADTLEDVQNSFSKCGFSDFSYELAPMQHPSDVATNVIFLYLSKR